MTASTTADLLRALGPGVPAADPVEGFVLEIIRGIDAEMRHLPASMVLEVLDLHVQRRLPGITVDPERLRDAAARIAFGVPVA
jgi:hypothetical protein